MSAKKRTWHPIIDEYAKYLSCKDRSERTIKSYSYQVQRLLEYTGKEPEALTQEDLDQYKLHLKSTQWAPGKDLDRNSYIPISGAINHLMDMLKKKEYRFTAAPARSKPVIPLTVDEVARIVQAAKKTRTRDYALICTLFYGALRISDALNLDIENVDFERKKIKIMDSKGGYSDEINLHDIALNAIKQYINTERKLYDTGSKAIFISEKTGERLRMNSIWKAFKDYAVEANITKRVNTHIYRHSFITHMAESEVSLPLIMKHSRHKDPKSAMKYIHVQEDKVKEAYNRVAPDIFSGTKNVPTPQPAAKTQPTIFQHNNKPGDDLLQRAFDSLEKGLINEETFKMLIGKVDQNSIKNEDKNNDNLSYIS